MYHADLEGDRTYNNHPGKPVGWLDDKHEFNRGVTLLEDIDNVVIALNRAMDTFHVYRAAAAEAANQGETKTVSELTEELLAHYKHKLHRYKGYHYCELCGGDVLENGKFKNPHRTDAVYELGPYVTNGLLLHYILRHKYAPPEEFIQYCRSFVENKT